MFLVMVVLFSFIEDEIVNMQKISKIDPGRILLILNKLPFFKAFSPNDRKLLTTYENQFLVYGKDEPIIVEGGLESSFYILISGIVRVTVGKPPIELAKLNPGDFFGEVSFLTDRPRTTNVVADDISIVLMIDQKLMMSLKAEIREKIKDNIIDKLLHRLDATNKKVREAKSN